MFRFMVVYMVAIFTFVPGAEAVEEPDSLDEAVVEVGETSIDMLLRRVQKLEGENAELRARVEASEKRLDVERGELQAVVKALQKRLEVERVESLSLLEEENERLRDSLRLVYRGRVENLPEVPMPNRSLLEEVLSDGRLQAQYEEQMEILETEIDAISDDPFLIIKEWGRSPEAVAQTSGNLSTLMGLSIFVHPDTSREDMEAYALALHRKYAHYDNLNIEFFDRESAAHAFAEKGTVDLGFRVMSISKYAKSGRDTILIGRGTSMVAIR